MTENQIIVTCANCGAKNRVDESKANPVCGRCHQALTIAHDGPTYHSGPVIVTDENFDREVLGIRDVPVLVDFWAAWCGPCRMLAPTLEEIARKANGKYKIATLNVDENQRTAGSYRISGIPAMLIFKNGQKIDELIGLSPKQTILAALDRAR